MIWGYHYFWKHPNGIYFSLKRGRNRNWCFLQTNGNFPGLHLLWHGWENRLLRRNNNTPKTSHPVQSNLYRKKHEAKTWKNMAKWYSYSKANKSTSLEISRPVAPVATCYTCDLLAQKSATRACRVRQVRTRETFFWWVILDLDGLDSIWFGWVGAGPKYCLKQRSEIRWYIFIYRKKESWVSARDK